MLRSIFRHLRLLIAPALILITLSLGSGTAHAHCDTMDGPVVSDAQAALARKDVAPVLKWISPTDEAHIRDIFNQTLAVRSLSEESRDIADNYFFESLVRIHRASEGEPFTGLKPAGAEIDPAILMADQAILQDDATHLTNAITQKLTDEITSRYQRVRQAKEHADENVARGREYVAAYVDFTHFVEQLHTLASHGAHHGEHNSGNEHHP